MNDKIYQKIQNFGTVQHRVETLKSILKDEEKRLASQTIHMYKSVYARLAMFFRGSKTPFSEAMCFGEIRNDLTTEDFCGSSPVKYFSWELSNILLGVNGAKDKQFNTNFIDGFTITQKEVDELDKMLSEDLGLSFSLLNKSYFFVMKK